MANGTSTSHHRLTIAEILGSPGRHEAYLAEVAAWAEERAGGLGPEIGPPGGLSPCLVAAMQRDRITITGNSDPAPTRRQVTSALLGEAEWFAERLTAAKAAERDWTAHVLVFTGLDQEPGVLSEVRSELRPRLLRQGILVGEPDQCPWPCFALNAGQGTGG